MKTTHIIFSIFLSIFITACNTTPKKAELVKKPLVSDHYLLMSLINRPVTTDQQIMLAFAKQQETAYGNVFVNTVSIKGPTLIDNSAPTNTYSELIANDVNAISLQGPIAKVNKI